MPAPPATGQRITWSDVPGKVRAGIERVLGDRVVAAESQLGGFSPGTVPWRADHVEQDTLAALAADPRRPAAPGLSTPRAFQRARADSTSAWLRRRPDDGART